MLRRILKRRGVDTRPAQPSKAIFPDTLTKHFECLANFRCAVSRFLGSWRESIDVRVFAATRQRVAFFC
jgi:hypothetical protein